jgi:glycosyltransferase involved in cell wall biosynthesis
VTLVRAAERAAQPAVREAPWPVELLTVGRIDSEKNPLLLVEAVALLDARDPGRFRLTWVGRGPLEPEVRERAAELDVLRLLDLRGYVPHGDALLGRYRSADVFVHVSLTEGVPQVLVEALATGTPIVATDVGGVRFAVADGAAALLVPPGDAEAVAEAIRRLADDTRLARSLAERGLELAETLTLEAEAARVARFLAAGDGSRDSRKLKLDTARV